VTAFWDRRDPRGSGRSPLTVAISDQAVRQAIGRWPCFAGCREDRGGPRGFPNTSPVPVLWPRQRRLLWC